MANKDREITIKVKLDGNNAVKGAAKVKAKVKDIGDESGKAGKSVKGFGLQTVATGAIAAAAFTKIAEYGSRAVKKAYRLATQAQETGSKFKTVLGPSIDEANAYLDKSAALMGLNETKAKDVLATTTAVAQGFGFTGKAAADFAIKTTKLAGDLTSFNNVPIERTQNAIRSALTGETEALKSLGIVLRQSQVQQRAMANTGKTNAKALTQQEKATASLQLITEKAGVAVGDLNRTQNSTANQARKAEAEFENLEIELSKRLLPVFNSVIGSTEGIVSTLLDWVKVPVSEQLRNERIEVNTLVSQITSLNKGSQRRNNLIANLQKNYPDFLGNLDVEKATNKDLADRLKEVNKQYRKKIAIQAQAEVTKDARQNLQNSLNQEFTSKFRLRSLIVNLKADKGLDFKTTGVKNIKDLAKRAKKALIGKDGLGAEVRQKINAINIGLGDVEQAEKASASAQGKLNKQMKVAKQIPDKYNVTQEEAAGIHQTEKEKLEAKKASIQKVIDAYQKRLDQIPAQSDGAQHLAKDLATEKDKLKDVNDQIKKLNKSGKKQQKHTKGLTQEIQKQQKTLDTLNNKKGEWTAADKKQAIAIAHKIDQLKKLLKKRKALEKIPPTPVVAPKKPNAQPIKDVNIDTSGGFNAGDPIIDTLNKRMLKQQSYTQLMQTLAFKRNQLRSMESQAARAQTQNQIDAIYREIQTRRMLQQTFKSGVRAQIDSLQELDSFVLNSVRKRIKARIASAVAKQIEKVISTVPFPFNVALAAAAGGAVSLLFNKVVPKFARGAVLEGPSHARGGIPIHQNGRQIAEAEGGEAFINRRSTRLYYNELSAINQAGGGKRFPGASRTVSLPARFAGGGPLKAQLSKRYAREEINSELIAQAVRQGLQAAQIVAPVQTRNFDEDLQKNRRVESTIGNTLP